MTDCNDVCHEMLMFRNPWGMTNYSGTWCETDPNWTDDLVAQVPHGVDPRTSGSIDGIFVTPKAALASDTGCFSDMTINYFRDDEGYSDYWIDGINMDEENHIYKLQMPWYANFENND